MTDSSTTPPTGGNSSGNSDPAPAPAPSPAPAGADDAWYSKFEREDLRTSPTIQGFKGPEDLAFAHESLLKRFGIEPSRRIDLPADPKDEAAMKAVWTRLGAPEKVDGYTMDFAKDAKPTDADKAMLSDWKAHALENSMPPKFAEAAMAFWNAKATAAFEANQAAERNAAEQGMAAIKTAWGAATDQKLKEVGNLLAKYGSPELQQRLETTNLGRDPHLALALGKIIDRMAEPGGGQDPLDAGGQPRAMTPDQAKAEIRKLEASKGDALRQRDHPEHNDVVKERARLLAFANPT